MGREVRRGGMSEGNSKMDFTRRLPLKPKLCIITQRGLEAPLISGRRDVDEAFNQSLMTTGLKVKVMRETKLKPTSDLRLQYSCGFLFSKVRIYKKQLVRNSAKLLPSICFTCCVYCCFIP